MRPQKSGLPPFPAGGRHRRGDLLSLNSHTNKKGLMALRERLGRKVRWGFRVRLQNGEVILFQKGPDPAHLPLSQPEGIWG